MEVDLCSKCSEEISNDGTPSPEEMTCADYYKDPKAHHSTQKTRLKDIVPNMVFYNVFMYNAHLFKDKIVLDVGCQSGLLCLFAAEMGAAKVIGIDSSSAKKFAEIAVENSPHKEKIVIVNSKIEEAELPEGIGKVDIIISEWIGYSLFHESILPSVIFSRNKWLKKDGFIFPDKARLYIAAADRFQIRDERLSYWEKVHGFTMKSIQKVCLSEAVVETIHPLDVVTNKCLIKEINLYTIKVEDLVFSSKFCLRVKQNEYVQAFFTYFDVEFSKCSPPVCLSTSPNALKTRWRQSVFYMNKDIVLKQGEFIKGLFTVKEGAKMSCEIYVDFEGELCQLKESFNFKFSDWN